MRRYTNMFLLLFFFATPISVQPLPSEVDMPEWFGQADTILAAVEIFYGEVDTDEKVYQNWNYTLENKLYELDQAEQEAQEFFGVMQEKFNQLQLDIADKQLMLQQQDALIGNFDSQMQAIKNSMEQEIVRLNSIVDNVNAELEAASGSYAQFKNTSEDKAQKLIETIVTLKNKYSQMIQNRAAFLSTLDTFVEKTSVHCAHQNEKISKFSDNSSESSESKPEEEAQSSSQVDYSQTSYDQADSLCDSLADSLADSLSNSLTDSLPDVIEQ